MATRTWSGGGTTNNWSDAGNWDTVPIAGDTLSFAGTTRLSPVNDIAAATSFAGISFTGTAGAFTLSGNSITLAGAISNNSTSLQTINIAMATTAVRTINLTSGNITIGGVISGTGGGIVVNGNNTLTLSANNTFTTTVTVNSGATLVSNAATVVPNTADFTIEGTWDLNGFAAAIDGFDGTSGTVTNSSSLVTLSIGNSNQASSTFAGLISGALNIDKLGTGTQTISGTANTYTGTTRAGRGSLQFPVIANVGVASSIGQPANSTDGIIQIGQNANTGNLVYTGNTASTDRAIAMAGGAGGATIQISTSGQTLTFTDTSAITFTNSQAAKTLTFNGAGNGVFNQQIVNTSTPNAIAVTKSGVGTWTLNNTTNSFTGVLSVSTGELVGSVIANGGTASSFGAATNVSTNILFNTGTLRYTGSTVSTDRSYRVTAAATAAIEVTNSATTLTWSGASTAIAGSISKLGPGTLVMSGTNLHTGSAGVVSGGTLSITGSFAAGAALSVSSGATLNGSGTVNGAVTVNNGGMVSGTLTLASALTVNSGGICYPGGSAIGTLTASAGVTFSSGSVLRVDVNGTGPTKDLLAVTGTATLNGVIEVILYSNQSLNTAFTILTATTVSGTFQPASSIQTLGGRSFSITYPTNTVVITDVGSPRNFLLMFM